MTRTLLRLTLPGAPPTTGAPHELEAPLPLCPCFPPPDDLLEAPLPPRAPCPWRPAGGATRLRLLPTPDDLPEATCSAA